MVYTYVFIYLYKTYEKNKNKTKIFSIKFPPGNVVLMARSPDFSVDYFGDLEGANVDELELSPRKEHTFRKMMNLKSGLPRQASDVSEASSSVSGFNISSTPDAEQYFTRKAILEAAAQHDGHHHEVIVGDLELEQQHSRGLEVLPLEGEIDILDLEAPPALRVKTTTGSSAESADDTFNNDFRSAAVPVRTSSFEALYDAMNLASGNFPLEGLDGCELPANLTRGSFHATFEVPQRVSSFEKLYEPQHQQQQLHEPEVIMTTSGQQQQDFLSGDDQMVQLLNTGMSMNESG